MGNLCCFRPPDALEERGQGLAATLPSPLQQRCGRLLATAPAAEGPGTWLAHTEDVLRSCCCELRTEGSSLVVFNNAGSGLADVHLLELAACGRSPWDVTQVLRCCNASPEPAMRNPASMLLTHLRQHAAVVLQAGTTATPKPKLLQLLPSASCQLLPAVPGQAMADGDVLLLGLSQRGSICSALALLWSPDAACTLTAADVAALSNVAQLLARITLGDMQHAGYLRQVCEAVRLMACATSLRSHFGLVLSAACSLLRARFGVEVRPVLALTHGSQQPAAFSVLDPLTQADNKAPRGVDPADLFARSGSIHLIDIGRPALPRNGSVTFRSGLAAGGSYTQPAVPVRTVLVSHAMTVLQSLLHEQQHPLQGSRSSSTALELDTVLSTPVDAAGVLSTANATAERPGAPCYRLISNCSAHLLDDQQPGRDVVLCQKLLQTPLQSLAVVLAPPAGSRGAAAGGPQDEEDEQEEDAQCPQWISLRNPAGCVTHQASGLVPTTGSSIMRTVLLEKGIGSLTHALTAPAGSAAGSAAGGGGGGGTAEGRGLHTAFYLCSGERLPPTLLCQLAHEMTQLAKLLLPALHARLAASAEWALLSNQLAPAAPLLRSLTAPAPSGLLPSPSPGHAAAGTACQPASRALSRSSRLQHSSYGGTASIPSPPASSNCGAGARPQTLSQLPPLSRRGAGSLRRGISEQLLGGRAGRGVYATQPSLALEELTPSSPLQVLVDSVHSALAEAPAPLREVPQGVAGRGDDRATVRQDLAGLELHEVLGRGGQGVVFRGSVHGLEAAVKVAPHRYDGEVACSACTHATVAASSAAAAAAPPASHPQQTLASSDARPASSAAAGGASSSQASAVASAGMAAAAEACCDAELLLDELRMLAAKRAMLRGALELAVTSSVSHPNIVQLYSYFTDVAVLRCSHPVLEGEEPQGELPTKRVCMRDDPVLKGVAAPPLHTVLCLEYCDAGTLYSAAKAGHFRKALAAPGGAGGAPGSARSAGGFAQPALVPLYTSLLEVALALRHLHAKKLVHGDVKAANVLLKSSSRDPRGWTCKLSDFGCVRIMNETGPGGRTGFRQAQPLGTLSFMAPEIFIKDFLLDGTIDVYAFGIMMWQLLQGGRVPYAGIGPKQLPALVVNHRLRPEFHVSAPLPYCVLASRCWSNNPSRRPQAVDLVGELQGLLAHAQLEERQAVMATAGQGAGTLPGHEPQHLQH